MIYEIVSLLLIPVFCVVIPAIIIWYIWHSDKAASRLTQESTMLEAQKLWQKNPYSNIHNYKASITQHEKQEDKITLKIKERE